MNRSSDNSEEGSFTPSMSSEKESPVPFVIEHVRSDESNGGYFVPGARLILQPALRMSGLLAALPDREAKSLLLLLTYLTPNGRIEPTTAQIADALQVPEFVARSRLGKLAAFRWQGERIVRHTFHETGLDSYRLSRSIVTERQAADAGLPATGLSAIRTEAIPEGEGVGDGTGSRDAVVAFSRAAYGRPLNEVERDIERRLGNLGGNLGGNLVGSLGDVSGNDVREMPKMPKISPKISPEVLEARRRLLSLGVSPAQVERLLARYPVEEVREQLDFLPDRNAKSPARYVVAAIKGHYEPPPRVRLERAIAQEEAAGSEKGERVEGTEGTDRE